MSPVSTPDRILREAKKTKGQAVPGATTVSSTAVIFPAAPHITVIMAGGGGAIRTRMEQILANRYAPLVLVLPLSQMPVGDYQKYMPKFFGPGNYTAEEHLEAFYAYAENINIEAEDVWMRIFVQSLDGEARKWFKTLPAASIGDITALDDAFLKYWGDRKDYLHYITEFGNIKRKMGESVSDFTKRFTKMYEKIPEVVKPSETSAMITYSGAFDYQFCLLLREREILKLL